MFKEYPLFRKIAYIVSTALGVAFGAAQAGFSAANTAAPSWFNVAMAVYAFLVAALGIQAATNITPPEE